VPGFSLKLSGQLSCPVAFHVCFLHNPLGTLNPNSAHCSFKFHRTQAVTATDENRRKRIVWRACHRGIKEMDIVMGTFVQNRIEHSDEPELQELERILEIPDQDLLAWLTGAQPVPREQQSALLKEMLSVRFDETFFGNPE
jgi:antitoxin CptB